MRDQPIEAGHKVQTRAMNTNHPCNACENTNGMGPMMLDWKTGKHVYTRVNNPSMCEGCDHRPDTRLKKAVV